MNKSIIVSADIKAYFSSHAALAALGRKVTKVKVFEPISQTVKIGQKTVKYSPSENCWMRSSVCWQAHKVWWRSTNV